MSKTVTIRKKETFETQKCVFERRLNASTEFAKFADGSCTYVSALVPIWLPRESIERTMLDVLTANSCPELVA